MFENGRVPAAKTTPCTLKMAVLRQAFAIKGFIRLSMVGLGRLELPTYGLGIQRAVLIGVENF
jgi:hypothetical protein